MFYFGVVKRIGVRELNQQTSLVMARVKKGESIEITERGRVIAKLEPVRTLPEPLATLVAQGKVIPPTSFGPLPVPLKRKRGGMSATEALLKMREEERY